MPHSRLADSPAVMTIAESLFTYGPGIPRYVGMWLVLTPLAVAVLIAGRVRWLAVAVFVAITLPSFAARSLPFLTPVVRYVLVTAALLLLIGWTIRRVAKPTADAGPARRDPVPWKALGALAVLTVAVRAPLAWIDPGISSIGLSTEHAVRELLSGVNPYAEPNPHANYGTYQYPVGTILANLPLVALMPTEVLGEQHLGIRATSWLVDVLNVVVLVIASARWGRARAGLVAGAAYALCAPLVRDSGLSTANDLLLALFVLLAVFAVVERRMSLAALAVGLAIAVKPPAVLLLPLLLGVAGIGPALLAAAVPALLQAPLLIWQAPGWKEIEALAEPAGRSDGPAFLANSIWYPLLAVVGDDPGVLRILAVVGILAAGVAACWAGLRLRRDQRDLMTVAAAAALPLLVVFALAPVPRLNYQDWYAPALILCVAHAVRGRRAAPEAGEEQREPVTSPAGPPALPPRSSPG